MEEPTTIPPTESGTPVRTRPPFTRVHIIVLAVVVLLIVLIAAAFFVPIHGKNLIDRLRAQYELRGLYVGDQMYNAMPVHALGAFGLGDAPVGSDQGVVTEYAKGGATDVALGVAQEGSAQVWLMGSAPRPLTESVSGKASLAVSLDGGLVAYAARSDGSRV